MIRTLYAIALILACCTICPAQTHLPDFPTPAEHQAANRQAYQADPSTAYLSLEFGSFVFNTLKAIDLFEQDKWDAARLNTLDNYMNELLKPQRPAGERLIARAVFTYGVQASIDRVNTVLPRTDQELPVMANFRLCRLRIEAALEDQKAPVWIPSCFDRL